MKVKQNVDDETHQRKGEFEEDSQKGTERIEWNGFIAFGGTSRSVCEAIASSGDGSQATCPNEATNWNRDNNINIIIIISVNDLFELNPIEGWS